MAEYWKSTPKYWCKFCAIYVKDTKFERAQHEATGRHQGSIQRSLRGLHREQEIEARNQARAKAEVARLNGLVPGAAAPPSVATGSGGPAPTVTKVPEKKATVEDRKKQWDQLAAMGVALPEEARRDLGMAGDWKVVKSEVVGVVNQEGEFETKMLNKGVHKRMAEEDEEEMREREMITKRKGWGHTYKSFPGSRGAEEDVERLFAAKKTEPEVKVEVEPDVKREVKEEGTDEGTRRLEDIPTEEEGRKIAAALEAGAGAMNASVDQTIKAEDAPAAPAVTFKKRKKKA